MIWVPEQLIQRSRYPDHEKRHFGAATGAEGTGYPNVCLKELLRYHPDPTCDDAEVRVRPFDTNWMQIEEYVRRDDRVVLPTGSTGQRGFLSLRSDVILAERVAVEAAEPLGIPILPALPENGWPQ
jgi:hypothetical protein